MPADPSENPNESLLKAHHEEQPPAVDQLVAALKELGVGSKKTSAFDRFGAVTQLTSTLVTLLLLVYGFIKFSKIEELSKSSETSSKVIAARYDKSRRIRLSSDLYAELDKKTESSPNSLYGVDWQVQVTNIAKHPVVIIAVETDCYLGKSLYPGQKELFLHFDPPGTSPANSSVTWTLAYKHVSSIDLKDALIKDTFGKASVALFEAELKKFLNEAETDTGDTRGFLTSLIQPDEAVQETVGFLVRSPRSDHIACVSTLRWCHENNKDGTCTDAKVVAAKHLWSSDSSGK